MQYEYNDKIALNKFDSISNAHDEALKAMGVTTGKEETMRDSPKLPDSMAYLYDEYRKLKFSIAKKDDGYVLYPRSQLTYTELNSYIKLTESLLKQWEVNLIMDIDAIFEGRSHG